MNYTNIRALMLTLLVGGPLACDLDFDDLNNPELQELLEDPLETSMIELATGLLIGTRSGISNATGYIAHIGVLGRESYSLNLSSDPRFVSDLLENPLPSTSPAYGGALWAAPYANIWQANTLIELVVQSTFTEPETDGVLGFAKTILAFDILKVISTRDINGAVIEVDILDTRTLKPIICKEDVYTYLVDTLDEAKEHLESAATNVDDEGNELPFVFPLGDGFEGFSTPSTFLQFNRALLARVETYRENFEAVLAALEESFINDVDLTIDDLNVGTYYSFSTSPGDITNGLIDPNLGVHPQVIADGLGDNRVARKVVSLEDPISASYNGLELVSEYRYWDDGAGLYPGVSAPIPIIRNEELILMRAEANLRKAEPDLEAAAADINLIREVSGQVDPLPVEEAATEDQLLSERRFSLLYEGGHRWIDMRRFDRLQELRNEDEDGNSDEVVFGAVPDAFPIPQNESDARGGDITIVCSGD